MYLQLFDPWRSKLCTCPPKYSLSPYTGCPHSCQYCYITAYVKDAFNCRPKKNFIVELSRELKKANASLPVAMASSSDPYPPIEKELELTRNTLCILLERGFKLLLLTKSDLVVRDVDLLSRGRAVVQMTITTLDENVRRLLEPGAPSVDRRMKALSLLKNKGIPCAVRVDPIVPGINEDVGDLMEQRAKIEISDITSSCYKAKADSLKRLCTAFPQRAPDLQELYMESGEGIGWSTHLPRRLRLQVLKRVKEEAQRWGMSFSTCRDGLTFLDEGGSCDGSHLLLERR